jgi:hypothetical protein
VWSEMTPHALHNSAVGDVDPAVGINPEIAWPETWLLAANEGDDYPAIVLRIVH